MPQSLSLLDQIRIRRMRGFWSRRAKSGTVSEPLRAEATRLRRILEDLERRDTGAAQTPEDPMAGLPGPTEWAHRPLPWHRPIPQTGLDLAASGEDLAPGTTLYHDGDQAPILIRQALSPASAGSAYQISIDVGAFGGSYISLALGLPKEEIENVERSDLVRLDLSYSYSAPVATLARINIKLGPNVEKITREIDRTRARSFVEFDLFYAELEAEKITDVWVDLLFENPSKTVITIQDLRLSRRPRARS